MESGAPRVTEYGSAAVGTSKRERQKQARQAKIEELRRTEKRENVRRRGIMIGAAVVAFLAFAIGFSILTSDDDEADTATVDSTEPGGADDPADEGSSSEDTTAEGSPSTTETTVAEVQAGPTECPAADGSAERRVDFEGPMDDCLEEGTDYQARFVTSEGEVLVDLREEAMPNTVNNFVALARYQYYDDTLMFRTDPSIDIIQGGSPHSQDPSDQGPGYTIPDEGGAFTTDPDTGQYTGPFTYEEGQLIMARSQGPDSSSAQYFFSTGPEVSNLDTQGTYLLFGDVVEGLDVLQSIMDLHEADPDSGLGGAPSRDVVVEDVEIIEA